jgi:hypothetical protein
MHNYVDVPLTATVRIGDADGRAVTVAPASDGVVSVPLPAGPRELRVASELAPAGGDELGLAVRVIRLQRT